jgi:hypothetical protein
VDFDIDRQRPSIHNRMESDYIIKERNKDES